MVIDSIGVLDSGVGGLSLLNVLNKSTSKKHFIYFGDSENNPYGSKSKRRLLEISFNNVSALISAGAKSVVLGCNTLSLSILPKLQEIFTIPIFGVFPPVESALMRKGKTLLLATPLTADYYDSYKNLTTLGLKNLASDIENNVLNPSIIDLNKHVSKGFCGFDNLILGCTHYSLIKNKICNHLKPLAVLDGAWNTVTVMSKKLKFAKTPVKHYGNSISFIGKSSKFMEKVWLSLNNNS